MWYNIIKMKILRSAEIIDLTISMFYKKCLIDNGYPLKFKKSYSRKLKELERKFGKEAEERIKWMTKFYEEIKNEFSYFPITKLDFPHPDLFFNDKIWEFTKALIPKKKLEFAIYKELVPEVIKAIENKNKEKIYSYLEKGYEKKKLFATIIKVYELLGKTPDEMFKEIYAYFKSYQRKN